MPTAALLDWLPGGKRVLTVTAGYEFTLLLADDNLLFAVCGTGQLGRGHSNADDPRPRYSRVPHPVTGIGLKRITHIAAGYSHCAAVTEGGKLLLWGWNVAG